MNSLLGIFGGHFAIINKWSVLSVRRLMTCIGLIGPSIFLLFFINTENLLLAIFINNNDLLPSTRNKEDEEPKLNFYKYKTDHDV
jgi:hypothetical protein